MNAVSFVASPANRRGGCDKDISFPFRFIDRFAEGEGVSGIARDSIW